MCMLLKVEKNKKEEEIKDGNINLKGEQID